MNLVFGAIWWWNENKRTKSTKKAWIDRQSNTRGTSKCMFQSLSEMHGKLHIKTTRKHIAWNGSYFTCSVQASKHTYFFEKYTYIVACCFRSTNIWGKFFLGQCDSTIISFCVKIEYSALMMQKCSLDWTLADCSHIQVWVNYPQP